MSEAEDKELKAIESIIKALNSIDKVSQERAIDYVLQRFDLSSRNRVSSTLVDRVEPQESAFFSNKSSPADIRKLKTEKSPKTAIEMAILVAYYLTEYAPIEERKSSVNTQDLEKYFKQASFKLPKYLKDTLPDAKSSGYVEPVSKGEYRLTPVGYNLAVHGLPKDKNKK